MKSKERWKDIPGYEGIYQISDEGRVKSLARVTPHGKKRKERMIKAQNNQNDYLNVTLHKNGKPRMRYVHRLVLESFVGPCPDGMQCRHLDGSRQNNFLNNLAWGTPAQNNADRKDHGTAPSGEGNGFAKLCELDVWLIRNCAGKDIELAEFFGISGAHVSRIRNYRAWRHV